MAEDYLSNKVNFMSIKKIHLCFIPFQTYIKNTLYFRRGAWTTLRLPIFRRRMITGKSAGNVVLMREGNILRSCHSIYHTYISNTLFPMTSIQIIIGQNMDAAQGKLFWLVSGAVFEITRFEFYNVLFVLTTKLLHHYIVINHYNEVSIPPSWLLASYGARCASCPLRNQGRVFGRKFPITNVYIKQITGCEGPNNVSWPVESHGRTEKATSIGRLTCPARSSSSSSYSTFLKIVNWSCSFCLDLWHAAAVRT